MMKFCNTMLACSFKSLFLINFHITVKGDTSSIECAHQLGKLCENRHLVVNLIPYNQTDVKDKLSCPSEEHMKEFQRIVTSYGSFCSIRRTMGADIAGACGQLVVSKEKSKEVQDIEDGPFGQNKKNTASKKLKLAKHKKCQGSKNEGNGDDDKSSTNDAIEKWIKNLAIGTTLSASICLLSIGIMLMQRRKK